MGRMVRATVAGLLFAAALALSLPGVEAVRAESPPVAEATSEEAPMCRADAPLTPPAVVEAVAAQLDARARAEATPDGPRIQVLNNRGYRYDPDRMAVDLRHLAREVAIERRKAR